MEKVYLTKEEIDQITDLQNLENNLVTELGNIEYQLQILTSNKEDVKERIMKMREQSDALGVQLQEKYGDGEINVVSGEFIKS